uniref:Uncharacterized protein n=1 Tax=Grammatophora oceanica TaxID=210454 RepID=A0A7S1UKQ4_9STRA|mmetsp:Transcript_10287/g.15003  ORF Transcript_10287/g.15003 Transcript_10287/m.15003 type:complete len:307 (+) Transcript_10287:475-1395(+)|eukprot:CAMPEP_0194028392 /NCGR_PEP_ID=MMETSP0009_2-20130614/2371_1 /TAXON_ID=210454 /ORGANISM="Grammatophora oceanica, Strain CCMP 410" /LENGTH=306 /DNA_ID=CAMNT_0038667773 /DNA_START=475 /DNA_END=1395 /DNA_ORIENTATION=+
MQLYMPTRALICVFAALATSFSEAGPVDGSKGDILHPSGDNSQSDLGRALRGSAATRTRFLKEDGALHIAAYRCLLMSYWSKSDTLYAECLEDAISDGEYGMSDNQTKDYATDILQEVSAVSLDMKEFCIESGGIEPTQQEALEIFLDRLGDAANAEADAAGVRIYTEAAHLSAQLACDALANQAIFTTRAFECMSFRSSNQHVDSTMLYTCMLDDTAMWDQLGRQQLISTLWEELDTWKLEIALVCERNVKEARVAAVKAATTKSPLMELWALPEFGPLNTAFIAASETLAFTLVDRIVPECTSS